MKEFFRNKASEYRGVMIFVEQDGREIHPISFELLGKGRELADKLDVELSAVLLGYKVNNIEELFYHGADKLFLFDHPSLDHFDVVRYKQVLAEFFMEVNPEIFLVGATRLGRSLGPRVAAALEIGLTADCIDLRIDERGDLIQIRPAFSGNILAHIKTKTLPQMATVRYKVMEKIERDPQKSADTIKNVSNILENTGLKILKTESGGEVDIAEANVIVCGGRGLKKPEDFEILKELSNLLGGVIGASRPVVDAGWIGKDHQVGFSGNTVKPHLYLACGVSGAPQHLAGMRAAKIIIAINNDPSAPIFKIADYGIVGDMYKVLPKLIEYIKNEKKVRELNV